MNAGGASFVPVFLLGTELAAHQCQAQRQRGRNGSGSRMVTPARVRASEARTVSFSPTLLALAQAYHPVRLVAVEHGGGTCGLQGLEQFMSSFQRKIDTSD